MGGTSWQWVVRFYERKEEAPLDPPFIGLSSRLKRVACKNLRCHHCLRGYAWHSGASRLVFLLSLCAVTGVGPQQKVALYLHSFTVIERGVDTRFHARDIIEEKGDVTCLVDIKSTGLGNSYKHERRACRKRQEPGGECLGHCVLWVVPRKE